MLQALSIAFLRKEIILEGESIMENRDALQLEAYCRRNAGVIEGWDKYPDWDKKSTNHWILTFQNQSQLIFFHLILNIQIMTAFAATFLAPPEYLSCFPVVMPATYLLRSIVGHFRWWLHHHNRISLPIGSPS
jgi:hypothetical protein